jgi:hypothetical protein
MVKPQPKSWLHLGQSHHQMSCVLAMDRYVNLLIFNFSFLIHLWLSLCTMSIAAAT